MFIHTARHPTPSWKEEEDISFYEVAAEGGNFIKMG